MQKMTENLQNKQINLAVAYVKMPVSNHKKMPWSQTVFPTWAFPDSLTMFLEICMQIYFEVFASSREINKH